MSSIGGISKLLHTKPIAIVKKSDYFIEKVDKRRQLFCSVTTNLNDPANFSPPNNFLENLKKRMNIYDESSSDCIKVESRERE